MSFPKNLFVKTVMLFTGFLFHLSFSTAQIKIYEILPAHINVGSADPDTFKIVIKDSTLSTIYPDSLDIFLADNFASYGLLPLTTGWSLYHNTSNSNGYVTVTNPQQNELLFKFDTCTMSCPDSCPKHCSFVLSPTDSLIFTYYTVSKCILDSMSSVHNAINFRNYSCNTCTGSILHHQDVVTSYPIVYPDISIFITPDAMTGFVGKQNLSRTTTIISGNWSANSVYLQIVQEPEIENHTTLSIVLPESSLSTGYTEHFSIGACSSDPNVFTSYSAYWKSSYATCTPATDVCQLKLSNGNIAAFSGSPNIAPSYLNLITLPDYCNDTIGKVRVTFTNIGNNSTIDSSGYASGLKLYLSDWNFSDLSDFRINDSLIPNSIIQTHNIPYGTDSFSAHIICLDFLTQAIKNTYGLTGVFDINHDGIYDDLLPNESISVTCNYTKRVDPVRLNTSDFNSKPWYVIAGDSYENMCGDFTRDSIYQYHLQEESTSDLTNAIGPADIDFDQTKTFEFTHNHYVNGTERSGCDSDLVYITLSRPPGYMIANYDSATGIDSPGSAIFTYLNHAHVWVTDTLKAFYSGTNSIRITIDTAGIFEDRSPNGTIKLKLTFRCRDYILHQFVAATGGADNLDWEMSYKCSGNCNGEIEHLGCKTWICYSHPCGPCPGINTWTGKTMVTRTSLGYVMPPDSGFYRLSELLVAPRITPNPLIDSLTTGYNGDTICVSIRGVIPAHMDSSYAQISYLTEPNQILTPLLDTTIAQYPSGEVHLVM